jgi:hypothetical protein
METLSKHLDALCSAGERNSAAAVDAILGASSFFLNPSR